MNTRTLRVGKSAYVSKLKWSIALIIIVPAVAMAAHGQSNLDRALQEAYDRGFSAGAESCREPSSGIEIPGITLGDGVAVGFQPPWIMQFGSSLSGGLEGTPPVARISRLDDKGTVVTETLDEFSIQEFMKQFQAPSTSSGKIILDNFPLDHFEDIERIIKQYGETSVWVAPSQ